MGSRGVLLDTSFLVKLLNTQDPLSSQCENYYRYFLEQEMPMYLSTIAIAEYCVKGKLDELPLRQLRVLPFNINHAVCAGELANIAFSLKKDGILHPGNRQVIPNDVKLLAQADTEAYINFFIVHDRDAILLLSKINTMRKLRFSLVDFSKPCGEYFGILDLK